MDTSKVVNPVEHLRGEIQNMSNAIDELDGQIATAHVHKARMTVLRDTLKVGLTAVFGEGEPEGQLPLVLDDGN